MSFEDIYAGLDLIDAERERRRDAVIRGYGVGWDDPDEPSILAQVEGGRLSTLTIHNSVPVGAAPENVAAQVNAILGIAYDDYSSDVSRLLG